MTPEEVQRCTILKSVVGSRCLGLETEESDTDEMGICVEPINEAMGLQMPFEQFVRTGPDAVREGPDLQIYGLRKFLRLALSGNPTILALLFIPADRLSYCDASGSQLRDLIPQIVSRNAGKAFLGYMQAQRMRLTGERGQKGVRRPELVEKFGYDTKYAMHVLRLGMQGLELMLTGRMQFPMDAASKEFLIGVRGGKLSLQDVLTRAGKLEHDLKGAMDSGCSPLPEESDHAAVEKWMLRTYLNKWKAREPILRHVGPDMDGRLVEVYI